MLRLCHSQVRTPHEKILPKSFFDKPTLKAAKGLIGGGLARKPPAGVLRAVITEVEAYDGFKDRASHAHRSKTKRNEIMFGPAGYWYIYFTYGMHWMLNIVPGPKDYPAAVLIRGTDLASGPGRLTKKFKINKKLNRKPAEKSSEEHKSELQSHV